MSKNGQKIGLALSGGGYRAAAYHIGTLRALRKLEILDKVDVISSISGGSIIAAYYALHKDKFDEFEKTFRRKLGVGVIGSVFFILLAEIVLVLWGHVLLIKWVLNDNSLCESGKITILIASSILILLLIIFLLHKIIPTSGWIEKLYALWFFRCKRMGDFPKSPIVAMNATDIEQNRLFTFSQIKMDAGKRYAEGYFKNDEIPISLAVMASSAYPLLAPVKIPRRYINKPNTISPILLDGGIYDNQGTHKLTENGDYHADYIVVSDAGNTVMNRKGTWNVVSLLLKVSNMMMNRIEKMQRREYLFAQKKYVAKGDEDTYPNYVYAVLEWLPAEKDFVNRFVSNINKELVPRTVCESHGLNNDIVARIIDNDTEAWQLAKKRIEEHIGWVELYTSQPNEETIKTAKSVSTGLSGLSNKKINALVDCAEWMTKVQVKLYMPELVPNE
jgi:NTE family protein